MSIKICVIGCGNISNSRHIPAIEKTSDIEIAGLISHSNNKIERTLKNHPNISGDRTFVINNEMDIFDQLRKIDWFVNDIDAVIIGTPPKQHYPMAKACLLLNKHVLVEKPMMMNVYECDEVIGLAKQRHLILNVMHSFQFAPGMIELKKRFESGELGLAKSILELQLTNRDRRLPVWYNELPLGLFYDEAAHFFIVLINLVGH